MRFRGWVTPRRRSRDEVKAKGPTNLTLLHRRRTTRARPIDREASVPRRGQRSGNDLPNEANREAREFEKSNFVVHSIKGGRGT